MITITAFGGMADSIVDELPVEFFRKLNGGVIISENTKLHSQSRPEAPLYILGEYCTSNLGKSIMLYYGSFVATYPHLVGREAKSRLREVILHEFRHHLEYLSGTNELEKDDAVRLAQYKAKYKDKL